MKFLDWKLAVLDLIKDMDVAFVTADTLLYWYNKGYSPEKAASEIDIYWRVYEYD